VNGIRRLPIGPCTITVASMLASDGRRVLSCMALAARFAAGAAAGRFVRRRVAEPAFQDVTHVSIVRATSAALMPSNASPYPTPSSIMRRSF